METILKLTLWAGDWEPDTIKHQVPVVFALKASELNPTIATATTLTCMFKMFKNVVVTCYFA